MKLLRIIASHLAHALRRAARWIDGNRGPAPMSPQKKQRGLDLLDKKIDDLNAARQVDWIHDKQEHAPLVALNLAIVNSLRADGITIQEFCAQHRISRLLLNEALEYDHRAIWEARRRAAEVLGHTDLYEAALHAAEEARRVA